MATGAERCGYVQSYALSGFRDGLSPARTRLAHKGLAVPPWSKRYRVGMNNLSLNRRSLALGAVALPLAAQEPEKEPQGPSLGAPAPRIRLNDQEGKVAQPGAPERWTLMAFYPKAATPG